MEHLTVITKKGLKVLIHATTLKEAFPAQDGEHTICVLNIKNNKSDDTFLTVKDTVEEIETKLKECSSNS